MSDPQRETVTRLEECLHQIAGERSRFVAAQSVAKIGSWETDLKTLSLVCSDETFHIFGIDSTRFRPAHRAFLRRIHPEDRRLVHDTFAQSFRRREPGTIEHRVRLIDGTIKWVEEKWQLFSSSDGPGDRAIGTCQDITERKKTEQQVTLLETCVAHLNDTVLITTADFLDEGGPKIVFVNDAFEKLTGYPRRDVLGRSPRFLHGEKTDGQVLKEISEALSRRQPIRREIINYGRDGSAYWIETDIVPIFNRSGKCTHFAAIQSNISERKRAEEQILEQASFLNEARDAIVASDLEGRISYWNQGAESLYGWKRDEAMGQKVESLIYADAKDFQQINGLTLQQGQWSGDVHHVTRHGAKIIVDERCTIIRDAQGRPKSILAIKTDITEKKKLEAQFMRAQRMESIGTLAGGIAHDLNNILAPIMLSINLLQGMARDEEARLILKTIEVSAKRGSDIVKQVLSFAKGWEGERVEVQPRHLLKDLEAIIKGTFPKNIRLEFHLADDCWTIRGDPTQVHQIILNLSVNARDAMPSGGTLTIDVANSTLDELEAAADLGAKAGRYVRVRVSDSGAGIPPEIMDKIFEPFFTTKEPGKGTGLGLSTALAIVKSHEGLINARSEAGKGSVFNVYLPALAGTLDTVPLEPTDAAPPEGRGETILVVDDEVSILTISQRALQAHGYRVLTSADGADAVAIYAQHKDEIALVLTDMMMPIMDGPATIRALSRINPAVKIIAASGVHRGGAEFKTAGMSVRRYLAKPYTAETLLRMVRAVLDDAN